MNVLHRVTRKTLLKNRTRTLVTIVGVVLSVAMVTAITIFISSMQDYLLRSVIYEEGDWQAEVRDLTYQEAQAIASGGDMARAGYVHPLGSARLEGGRNAEKPYLYVQALDEAAFSMRGIRALEGRLPENENELLVAEHIRTNGGVTYAVGQTLTLAVGDRVYGDGNPVEGNAGYQPEEFPESLREEKAKTYTVVGICARPDLEDYFSGGYSVFTRLDPAALRPSDPVWIELKLKRPASVFGVMPELAASDAVRYHSNMLRYMGISANDHFNAVLYSMAAILITLIMVGSISLIYNAFAISVSERSRQFGMLSSAGATSRQIRNCVFYEALLISGIGIPLGLASGVAGIGVTLYCLKDSLNGSAVLREGVQEVGFRLTVSVPALVIAAAIGLLTVLLSAWIPAKRAARMSAMDAIRQTKDIRLKARQVKTPRIVRRLFGMEGDLALKNSKRNRRRYRATVFSLFISVVLFISVSTYTSMLRQSVGTVYEAVDYDLKIGISRSADTVDMEEARSFLQDLRELDSVQQASMLQTCGSYAWLPANVLSDEAKMVIEAGQPEAAPAGDERAQLEALGWKEGEDLFDVSISVIVLDDASFEGYLRALGLDKAAYTDPARPQGIVLDRFMEMNAQRQYVEGHMLSQAKPLSLRLPVFGTGGDEEKVPSLDIALSAFADKAPLGLELRAAYPVVRILVSRQVLEAQAGYAAVRPSFVVKALDPDKAEEAINKQMKGYTGYYCHNLTADIREIRNTLLVTNVLSYGFIILISLITTANVFNTISTNVSLRRREFAMLRSVGMTPRGFHKMMNFECLFYGLKALLYGLPVSLAVAWLIRCSLREGVVTAYELPWASIGVAVLSVFLVVFITMLYAMSKIRKENIIDALKNENL